MESWRWDPRCKRLQRLIATTRSEVLDHLRSRAPGSESSVIGPAIWNGRDYRSALLVFLDLAPDQIFDQLIEYDADFLRLLERGGRLDPSEQWVYASRRNGALRRLLSKNDAPTDMWLAQAEDHQRRGIGHTIVVVCIRR